MRLLFNLNKLLVFQSNLVNILKLQTFFKESEIRHAPIIKSDSSKNIIFRTNIFCLRYVDLVFTKKRKIMSSHDHKEGKVTKEIEKQTAKLPSDVFLIAALASMGASLTLKILDKKNTALFVGQWAAPFLLLGIYNKMVKQDGHDKTDKDPS